ncbi:hypothetical protein SLEP1_g49645 [Rubroshorea leprosula]|uniref:Uncharacterized protein n=1 Tax=Rubroshorea leprosula TaxID=152421 RepID=A0AAV5LYE3_9ROSI|nr:hypothetical protein SLEP1_g49645 [Rubroshorea leprosula]
MLLHSTSCTPTHPTPYAPVPFSTPNLALHSPLCAPNPAIIPLHTRAIIQPYAPLARPALLCPALCHACAPAVAPRSCPCRLRSCCCTAPAPPALCAPIPPLCCIEPTAMPLPHLQKKPPHTRQNWHH